MGFGKVLKAVLALDNRPARRAAKQTKKDMTGLQAEIKQSGQVGKEAFGAMAKALTVVGGAAITATKLIENLRVASQNAAAAAVNAADVEGQRMGGAASTLGDIELRQIQDVTGQSPAQTQRAALRAAAEYNLPGAQTYRGAIAPLGARAGALDAGMLDPTLTFAGGRGVSGEGAGGLAALGIDLYGAETSGQLEQFLGSVGAAAQTSGYLPSQFTDVLTRIGPAANTAGMTLSEQLGMVGGMSPFTPGQPELGAMGVKQLMRLRYNRKPGGFLDQLITSYGADPKAATIQDILGAVRQYMAAGKGLPQAQRDARLNKLQQETEMPIRILEQVERMGQGVFATKYAEAYNAAEGAQGLAVERARIGADQSDPFAQRRARGFREEARALDELPAGGVGEAGDILSQAMSEAADFPDSGEAIAAFGKGVNELQANMWGSDTPLTDGQIRDLFLLNKVAPKVLAQLQAIIDVDSNSPSAPEARRHQYEVGRFQAAANKPQGLGYEQQEFVEQFKAAMQNAIQFIKRVGLGKPTASKGALWGRAARGMAALGGIIVNPGEGQMIMPSPAESEAVGVSEGAHGAIGNMGLEGLPGGIQAATVIINNNRGSRETNERTKTGK